MKRAIIISAVLLVGSVLADYYMIKVTNGYISVSSSIIEKTIEQSVAGPTNWWDDMSMSGVWKVDDGSGTNIVPSVGVVTGIFAAATSSSMSFAWTNIAGISCLSFNTVTNATGHYADYVTFGDNFDMLTNSISVGAWCRKISAISYAMIIHKTDIEGNVKKDFGLYHDSTGLKFSAFVNQANVITDATSTLITNWYFVALVWNRASGMKVYRDGVCVVSNTFTTATSYDQAFPFSIGGNFQGPDTFMFHGQIRDVFVRVSPAGLTDAEIAVIYSKSRTPYK